MGTVNSEKEDVSALLLEMAPNRGSRESLAARLGVSASSLSRWARGTTRPRPEIERQIRAIHTQIAPIKNYQGQLTSLEMPLIRTESALQEALLGTLQGIREVLYRSGRLSSRHEALDEIAKLIFAHVACATDGKVGITASLLDEAGGTSRNLRRYVEAAYSAYLPRSLSHELKAEDFRLRIKDSEEMFARELITSFSPLLAPEVTAALQGAGGIDILNDTFGQFLADSFIDEKELGQYLTPTEVVQFMVRLGLNSLGDEVEPWLTPAAENAVGHIFDPSCGVASFLAETLKVLWGRYEQRHSAAPQDAWIEKMLGSTLVGIDKSERMIKLALTNLALFGAPSANLHLANSLSRMGEDGRLLANLSGTAKLILTNPPFGAEFDSNESLSTAPTEGDRKRTKTTSEILFLERYAQWLAPGGVLVAVVPDSVLTHRGVFERLRSSLSSQMELLGVVSLPPVTFAVAGTMTKTSVLHLRKRRAPQTEGEKEAVFFAVCKNIGYAVVTRASARRKVFRGQSDLPTILLEACRQNPAKLGRIVSIESQRERWDASYHTSLAADWHSTFGGPTQKIRVGEVATLATERVNPRRRGGEQFSYIEIGDVDGATCAVRAKSIACAGAPSRARKLVRAGDVLVSRVRPELRTVGVVPSELDGAICSTGFAVLRPHQIHPYLLAKLLQSDFVNGQMARNNTGIAYPSIEEDSVPGVLLPLRGEDFLHLEEEARAVQELREKMRALESKFSASIEERVADALKKPHE